MKPNYDLIAFKSKENLFDSELKEAHILYRPILAQTYLSIVFSRNIYHTTSKDIYDASIKCAIISSTTGDGVPPVIEGSAISSPGDSGSGVFSVSNHLIGMILGRANDGRSAILRAQIIYALLEFELTGQRRSHTYY